MSRTGQILDTRGTAYTHPLFKPHLTFNSLLAPRNFSDLQLDHLQFQEITLVLSEALGQEGMTGACVETL